MTEHITGFIEYVINSPLFYVWTFALQILLCTRKNVFIGLILPLVFLMYSLIVYTYLLATSMFFPGTGISDDILLMIVSSTLIPGFVFLGMFISFLVLYRKGLNIKKSI
jgi:hypothetical protein